MHGGIAAVVARPSLRPLVLVAALLLGAIVAAVATTNNHYVRPPRTRVVRVHPQLMERVWQVGGRTVVGVTARGHTVVYDRGQEVLTYRL